MPPPSISTLANVFGLPSRTKLSTTGHSRYVPANRLFGRFLLAGGGKVISFCTFSFTGPACSAFLHATFLSSIIREMSQNYNNYFRLSFCTVRQGSGKKNLECQEGGEYLIHLRRQEKRQSPHANIAVRKMVTKGSPRAGFSGDPVQQFVRSLRVVCRAPPTHYIEQPAERVATHTLYNSLIHPASSGLAFRSAHLAAPVRAFFAFHSFGGTVRLHGHTLR